MEGQYQCDVFPTIRADSSTYPTLQHYPPNKRKRTSNYQDGLWVRVASTKPCCTRRFAFLYWIWGEGRRKGHAVYGGFGTRRKNNGRCDLGCQQEINLRDFFCPEMWVSVVRQRKPSKEITSGKPLHPRELPDVIGHVRGLREVPRMLHVR